MPSYDEQLSAASKAHSAVSALEQASRTRIQSIFQSWESGDFDNQQVRHELENAVRQAYRAAGSVAGAHARRQSGLFNWTPAEVFNSTYLDALLFDVRKNLREFKRSDRTEKDRRRALLRLQYGVAVAAQRGFTDSLLSAYDELRDFGFKVRKVWVANFVDNTPCAECTRLHGTEVDLKQAFPGSKLKVYINLQGPPRHPNCHCHLVLLLVSLENALEKLDFSTAVALPQMMSNEDVKQLPIAAFRSVLSSLRKIVVSFRRKS